MNKKVMIAGAISLAVAVVLVLNKTALRTLPTGQRMAQTNTSAVMTTPGAQTGQIKVKLVGITTILNTKKALIEVQWPPEMSRREESCILSEGQSQDGVTVESIDTTNGAVKVRMLQTTRILRVDESA